MAVLSELTVVIGAEGTQSVVDALRQVENAQSNVQGATKKSTDAAKESAAGWQSTLSAMSGFGKQFIATGAEIAMAAAPLAAAIGGIKVAADFAEAGAQIERLEVASSSLAMSMGADMGDIMDALKATSLGMVSDYDLMLSASRAMMLGVSADADQLAQLLEVAALRGRAMGLSTTQAFNDIVTGIGRASPLILDNLGIVIDADTTYASYAESIGKASEELSKAEKTQALLNGVLASTAPLLEATGGLLMDNAGQWERLTAQSKNYFDTLKQEIGGGDSFLGNYAEAIGDAFESATLQMDSKELIEYAHRIGLITDAEYNWSRVPIISTYETRARWVDILTPKIEAYEAATAAAALGTQNWTDRNYESASSMTLMSVATTRAALDVALAEEAIASLEEQLADADLSLNVAITTFKQSVGGDLVKGLKDAGLETGKLLEKLGWIDQVFGTNAVLEYKLELATDDLLQDLINADDITDFLPSAEGLIGYFAPLNTEVAAAMGVVAELDAALAALEREYTVRITILTSGGLPNVGGGGVTYEPIKSELQALGGPVYPNTNYIVGERGPESFVPSSYGHIVTNSDLSAILGGGGTTTSSVDIDYKRLAKAFRDGLVGAMDEGQLGNTYINTNSSNRESVAATFELLRGYGGNH